MMFFCIYFVYNSELALILSLLVFPVHLSLSLNKCFVFFLIVNTGRVHSSRKNWECLFTKSICSSSLCLWKQFKGRYHSHSEQTIFLMTSFDYFSFQSFIVAIVVPDAEVLEGWARSNGLKGDMKELCQNEVNRFRSKNKLLELKIVK